MEVEWEETRDLIENMVPPQRLIGRNIDILAGAVIVERLYAKLTERPFDRKEAVWKVLNTGRWDGQ
mgnify:CR=1 FL=1